jgi:GTP pyrophosphokinase
VKDIIKDSITIIENNLQNKISLDIIANQMGYSKYHYSKLFKKHTGVTVHNYITNRRMICSAKDILNGERIVNVAMNYGYDTQSGFSKAFVKKFGFPANMLHAMRFLKELFSDIGGLKMNVESLYTELRTNLQKTYNEEQLIQFDKAYLLVSDSIKERKRYSGEPYMIHQLSVAALLEKMDLPLDTIILGLLHEALSPGTTITKETLMNKFGTTVYDNIQLVEQIVITKKNITQLLIDYNSDIIMIKLADRLHNMKTLQHLSPVMWEVKAKETIQLFMPLAQAMGLEEFSMELEHLSLKYFS